MHSPDTQHSQGKEDEALPARGISQYAVFQTQNPVWGRKDGHRRSIFFPLSYCPKADGQVLKLRQGRKEE